MQRICFLLKVRQPMIEEYKRIHSNVWPEMLEALRQSGWHNYSLFLRPDGLLVGYLETPDFQKAIEAMKGHAVNERWQKQMTPYFEGLDAGPDDGMVSLEKIFHLQ